MKKCVLQSDHQSLAWYEAESKKIDSKILELKLAKPALRALVNASIYSVQSLRKKSIAELSTLHGMGPNAVKKLQQLLLIVILILSCSIFSNNHLNAQDMDRMYRIAKIKVDPTQIEKYTEALQTQMKAAINNEAGVLSYTALADKKEPTQITIVEIYASTEAYQKHILTQHFKTYKETVKNMVLSLELIDTNLVANAHQKDF